MSLCSIRVLGLLSHNLGSQLTHLFFFFQTVNPDRPLNHFSHWKEARINAVHHAKGVKTTRDITFTSQLLNQAEQKTGEQVWHIMSHAVNPLFPTGWCWYPLFHICRSDNSKTHFVNHSHDGSPCLLCGGANIYLSESQPGNKKST